MPGRLIVFEGVEGAGKSTQIRRLSEWLGDRGETVLLLREPGGTALGDQIRRMVLDDVSAQITPEAEALLFMSSRAQLVSSVMQPALARGDTVLLDRFFLSTYAYQGAGRRLPLDRLRGANALATGGLIPDLTILLRLDPSAGLDRAAKRGGHDRIEGAQDDFHQRVAAAFAEFAEPAWQATHPECGHIVAVDGEGSPDEVFARVRDAIIERWPASFPA